MCHEQMGTVLMEGSYPMVVLNTGFRPYCDLSQVRVIKAPRSIYGGGGTTLHSFPPAIALLTNVKEIDVKGHNIVDVPMEMLDGCSLPKLSNLHLDGNPVSKSLKLSSTTAGAAAATQFSFDYVPMSIATFFQHTLESIDVSNTKVKCVPKWFVNMPTLKKVNFSDTQVDYVSPELIIHEMRKEKYPNATFHFDRSNASVMLDWSYEFYTLSVENPVLFNELFPTEVMNRIMVGFGTLARFKYFNLAGNQLHNKTLPNLNGRMIQLTTFDISHNLIEHAPWSRFDALEHLNILNVSSNRLSGVHFEVDETYNSMTCQMLERFRSMSTLDAKDNNILHLLYNNHASNMECQSKDNKWVVFKECPQGEENVLNGFDALLHHVLPYLHMFEYNVYECLTGRKKRPITLSTVFLSASPEKLKYFKITNVTWGTLLNVSTLQNFVKLKSIHFETVKGFSSSDFIQKWLNGLFEIKNLKELHADIFNHNAVTTSLVGISKCTSLYGLELAGDTTNVITPTAMNGIIHLPKLRHLELRNNNDFRNMSPESFFSQLVESNILVVGFNAFANTRWNSTSDNSWERKDYPPWKKPLIQYYTHLEVWEREREIEP